MSSLHTLFIGSYTRPAGDKTHFNLYLGDKSANLAKYLYGVMGIDLYIHQSHVHLTEEQFRFVKHHIGTTYTSELHYKDLALPIEEDVDDLCRAYNVIKVWNGAIPLDDEAPAVLSGTTAADATHSYYILYNGLQEKSIVVYGGCPHFQNCAAVATPPSEWTIVHSISLNDLDDVDQFYSLFHNIAPISINTLHDRIRAFRTLYC